MDLSSKCPALASGAARSRGSRTPCGVETLTSGSSIWHLASGRSTTGVRLRRFSKTHLSKISPTLSLLVSQAGWVQRSFTLFHRSLLLPTSEGYDRGASPGVEKPFWCEWGESRAELRLAPHIWRSPDPRSSAGSPPGTKEIIWDWTSWSTLDHEQATLVLSQIHLRTLQRQDSYFGFFSGATLLTRRVSLSVWVKLIRDLIFSPRTCLWDLRSWGLCWPRSGRPGSLSSPSCRPLWGKVATSAIASRLAGPSFRFRISRSLDF